MSARCEHLEGVEFVDVVATECPQCVAMGDTWLHLRQCVECGAIGCCDGSKNKHASAHARAQGHPVLRTAEPGEMWVWCVVHEVGANPH